MARSVHKACLVLRCAACALISLFTATNAAKADRTVNFEQQIAPIFAAACNECHGAKTPQGDLRLDSRASALKGGFSGPAIEAGSADKSEIYQRITSSDPDLRMP